MLWTIALCSGKDAGKWPEMGGFVWQRCADGRNGQKRAVVGWRIGGPNRPACFVRWRCAGLPQAAPLCIGGRFALQLRGPGAAWVLCLPALWLGPRAVAGVATTFLFIYY